MTRVNATIVDIVKREAKSPPNRGAVYVVTLRTATDDEYRAHVSLLPQANWLRERWRRAARPRLEIGGRVSVDVRPIPWGGRVLWDVRDVAPPVPPVIGEIW